MDPIALLLADSRFPSGSYAHSLGLEQAVADGLTDVPAFMAARLDWSRRPTRGSPWRRARGTAATSVAAIDAEWAARCPSPVLREAARRLGAQLLRSAAAVWPGGTIAAYRLTSRLTPRPIALGVVAAAAGVSDEDTALLALYDDAATVASAALKLLPLDPALTARWLAELAPELARMAPAVAADRGPLPAPAAVALELSAPVHLLQRERLFAS